MDFLIQLIMQLMLLIANLNSHIAELESQRYRSEPTLQVTIPYWPVEEHEKLSRIIHCESRGIATADTNPPHKGLLQINEPLFKLEFPEYNYLDLLDPNSNLLAGFLIWQRYVWRMWECQ